MMKIRTQTKTVFVLQPNEVRIIHSTHAQNLVVEAAPDKSVWITRRGDIKDYWLATADSIALHPGDELSIGVEPGTGAVQFALTASDASPLTVPLLQAFRTWFANTVAASSFASSSTCAKRRLTF